MNICGRRADIKAHNPISDDRPKNCSRSFLFFKQQLVLPIVARPGITTTILNTRQSWSSNKTALEQNFRVCLGGLSIHIMSRRRRISSSSSLTTRRCNALLATFFLSLFAIAPASAWVSTRTLPISYGERIQQQDSCCLLGMAASSKSSSTETSSRIIHDAMVSDQSFRDLYGNHKDSDHENNNRRIPDWLLERCEDAGWTHPTLIQERSLDAILSSQQETEESSSSSSSFVIQAQTGSGKTLTYLLPVLSKIDGSRAAIQALIVVPTRELGLQVASVAKRLVGRRFLIMNVLQGSSLKRQRAWAWAETPQVVIGTPSELLDMVQLGGLPRINSIQTVVVDEVDACLVHSSNVIHQEDTTPTSTTNTKASLGSSSTASALHILLSKHLSPTYLDDDDEPLNAGSNSLLLTDVPKSKQVRRRVQQHRQTLFCSATIPQHNHFLKQCVANQWVLQTPQFICTSPGESLPPTLKHGYIVAADADSKLPALRRTLQKVCQKKSNKPKKILIFCEPHRDMEYMAEAIANDLDDGIVFQEYMMTDDSIHSDIVSILRMENSLSQRAAATKAFASTTASTTSSNRIMFTTDVAARGLDIMGITHVIHYDLANSADSYVHRSGRAGRFGRKGQVISIITSSQEFVLKRLANVLSLQEEWKCIGRQTNNKK